jgi:gliding motility-associated-like protein
MKIFFTIPLLALTINSLSQIPTNGLIGYWPFNGNANDESGNGNDGIVYGATLTEDRCGNKDSAYSFNGVNSYIDLTNTSTLNLFSGFSLVAWVNFTDSNDHNGVGGSIVSKHVNYYQNGSTMSIYKGYVQLSLNNSEYNIKTPEKYNDGKWHLFIGTYDGSISSLYIDGVLSVSANAEFTIGNDENFRIGSDSFLSFFNGTIDDVCIYNRALSSEEILSLFNTNCNIGSILGESEVCQGQENVSFNVQPIDGATSYTWDYSGTGAKIINNSNNSIVDFARDATNGDLSVTIEGNDINTQFRSVRITVNGLPVAPGIITGNNEVCSGQNGLAYVVPTIDSATSYIWSYSGTGATITAYSNIISIDFADNATSGNLSVAGNNDCGVGPVSEDFSIDVVSCENTPTGVINIPNSFSPNGDGINDLFIIRGLIENSRVMIYDRSGKKLYESDNYQNDWNGRDNDGNPLESDTYWYVIHISGIPSEFKGFVYLKR